MIEETPKGKRRIHRTIRGSLRGYVSNCFWVSFGHWDDPHAQMLATEWMNEKSA